MITDAKIVGRDVDPEEYHRQAVKRGEPEYVMSRSELAEFARCPSRWLAGVKPHDSDSTDWGSLMDCLVLTPKEVEKRFSVKPATYKDEKTGEQKKWNGNANVCKAWIEEQAGKRLVSNEDYHEAIRSEKRLNDDPTISDYLDCSDKQVHCTAIWQDKETGRSVPLKVLIDLVPLKDHETYGKSLGDFKTARDAAVRAWSRQVASFDYHWQAALFLDVYVAATGEDRLDFRHIIQENEPPYQTAKRIITTEFVQLGRDGYQLALKQYCRCLATGVWPDYDTNEPGYEGWSFVAPEAWMVKA